MSFVARSPPSQQGSSRTVRSDRLKSLSRTPFCGGSLRGTEQERSYVRPACPVEEPEDLIQAFFAGSGVTLGAFGITLSAGAVFGAFSGVATGPVTGPQATGPHVEQVEQGAAQGLAQLLARWSRPVRFAQQVSAPQVFGAAQHATGAQAFGAQVSARQLLARWSRPVRFAPELAGAQHAAGAQAAGAAQTAGAAHTAGAAQAAGAAQPSERRCQRSTLGPMEPASTLRAAARRGATRRAQSAGRTPRGRKPSGRRCQRSSSSRGACRLRPSWQCPTGQRGR